MKRSAALALLLCACRSPASAPAPTAHPASDAGTVDAERDGAPPAPTPALLGPLGTHGISWSRSGTLVAANETFACGPPSGNGDCHEESWIRAVDVTTPGRERRGPDGDVFGFRADGEWLVVRPRKGTELEEWSALTGETRPSPFQVRARDASAVCLSPDDEHLVATLRDQAVTVVRSRKAEEETSLDPLTFAPLPPRDCAFTADGRTFARSRAASRRSRRADRRRITRVVPSSSRVVVASGTAPRPRTAHASGASARPRRHASTSTTTTSCSPRRAGSRQRPRASGQRARWW